MTQRRGEFRTYKSEKEILRAGKRRKGEIGVLFVGLKTE